MWVYLSIFTSAPGNERAEPVCDALWLAPVLLQKVIRAGGSLLLSSLMRDRVDADSVLASPLPGAFSRPDRLSRQTPREEDRPCGAGEEGCTGSVNQNVAPCPGRLSTPTSPCCRWIKCRQR